MLGKRGLNGKLVAEAGDRMEESSNLFRTLRYEENLGAAADVLERIADRELEALHLMDRAWPEVKDLK